MEKLLKGCITTIMIFALAFIITGCGKAESKTAGDNKQEPIIEGNDQQVQAIKLTTVDNWLSYWGLTVEQLTPVNFTRLDKAIYSLETGEIKAVGAYINKALTIEEARAWLEKVLSKLASLSEEGKVLSKLEDDAELTADYIMGTNDYIGNGRFTYKGKTTNVLINVTPNQLDNSDLNIAMPACTLRLEH